MRQGVKLAPICDETDHVRDDDVPGSRVYNEGLPIE
jgi:hypothetical protein